MSTPKEIWENEYIVKKSLPSSYRNTPSRGLILVDSLIPFTKNNRVLDLGCGIGRNALYLASKGLEVDAIDFSNAALTEFKKRLDTSNANCEYIFFPLAKR